MLLRLVQADLQLEIEEAVDRIVRSVLVVARRLVSIVAAVTHRGPET